MFSLNLTLGENLPATTPDLDDLHRHCRDALLEQKHIKLQAIDLVEISIQCVSCDEMARLNHQYRHQDKPTNVLSFESAMPALVDDEGRWTLYLGDLVFCADIIEQEAESQGKPLHWHWCHLLVHGTLHLCGYDHTAPDEANNMETMEIRILSGSGISNPYQMYAQP